MKQMYQECYLQKDKELEILGEVEQEIYITYTCVITFHFASTCAEN